MTTPTPAGRWLLPSEGVVTGNHPQRGKTAARGLLTLGQRTQGPLADGGTRELGAQDEPAVVDPPTTGVAARWRPAVTRAGPGRRVLLADYVEAARGAWTPDVVVTPAWVRQVTTCSRGLSPKVAATLTAQLTLTPDTEGADRTDAEGRAA